MPSTTWLLSRLGVPTRFALAIFSLRRQRVAEVPDARRLANAALSVVATAVG
ncbi:MAG: hypothetical protein RMY28_012630 [Nostoc sp. ChiSLP01]